MHSRLLSLVLVLVFSTACVHTPPVSAPDAATCACASSAQASSRPHVSSPPKVVDHSGRRISGGILVAIASACLLAIPLTVGIIQANNPYPTAESAGGGAFLILNFMVASVTTGIPGTILLALSGSKPRAASAVSPRRPAWEDVRERALKPASPLVVPFFSTRF